MMLDELNAIDNIAAQEAKAAVAWLPSTSSIEDRLRAAMKVTKNHWMLTQLGKNEGRELRAAVAGVLLHLGMEHADSKRIIAEHQALAKSGAVLEALLRGVPVDWDALIDQTEADAKFEPVGLLAIWKSLP